MSDVTITKRPHPSGFGFDPFTAEPERYRTTLTLSLLVRRTI